MTNKCKTGFTLIELMIVVAVVGILAAIAYPSYTDSVQKARRADGKAALMNAAQKMEAYFARTASYADATLGPSGNTNILTTSEEGYYTISINSLNAADYTLEATPAGSQVNDDIKGFRLTSTGKKNLTLDGSDWSHEGWDK